MESRGFKGAKRPPARPPSSTRSGAGLGPVRGPEPALARPSDQDATAPDSAAGTKLRAAMRTDSSVHYSLARRTARATRPTSPCSRVSPYPYTPRRPEIVDLKRFYGPHLLRNVWTGSGNGLRAPLVHERAPIVATNGNLSLRDAVAPTLHDLGTAPTTWLPGTSGREVDFRDPLRRGRCGRESRHSGPFSHFGTVQQGPVQR